MFQAQMTRWQEAAAAQMNQLQANMQATFDLKLAELTRIQDGGGGRRESRDDSSVSDVKHFRLCKVFDGTCTGVKWEEWKFNFPMVVTGRNAECGRVMEELLKGAALMQDLTSITVDADLKRKCSSQLFSSCAA